MIRLYDFSQLEKILVEATLEIVDQVASWIPVVLRTIKYFELDESRLACLHCSVVFIPRMVLLRREVFNMGKCFYRILLLSKERRNPAAKASALLFHLGQFYFVLELHPVLLFLQPLTLFSLMLPTLSDFPAFHLSGWPSVLRTSF